MILGICLGPSLRALFLKLLAALLFVPATAAPRSPSGPKPQSYEVRCDAMVNGTRHVLNLRVAGHGKIIPYSKRKLVNTSDKSIFNPLAQPPNKYRSIRSFKAPNDYLVLTVKTHDEIITVGLSPGLNIGYYTYNDWGSGLGYLRIHLKCKPLAVRYH